MDLKWWEKVKEVFNHALEISLEEQERYLAEACAGDDELRREVAELLVAHAKVGSFLQVSLCHDNAPSPEPLLIGQELANYRIDSLLGRGGMGEVYLAEDKRLHRKVALKLLPAQFMNDAERVRRFKREAVAASATNHPNILTIYEIGHAEGHQFIATEFVDGVTLRQSMQSGEISIAESLSVAVQVASALSVAHEAGIIHRDIKPENVMARSDGLVKVLDFGLAKLTERSAAKPDVDSQAETMSRLSTESGVVMGTASYMSPEQVRGLKVDHRTDIFSLGVMLYEMMAGRRPFEGATTADVIAAILDKEPAPLTDLKKTGPSEFERITRHCLEKNPGQRYQSARDLASDLKALLGGGGQAISASSLARQQRRPVVWLAAALVIALIGLGAWFYMGIWRETPIDSLAVLPLVNASGDANLEYLSDGITESLINSLSQLPQLKRVIARSSVETYKGKSVEPRKVGQELNVRAVLTGKMIQRSYDLSLTTELVNATDGARLWGGQYNCKLTELFAVQEEIASNISECLRLKLSGEERRRLGKRQTTNIEAHQLYLKGRYHLNNISVVGLKKAIGYFKQAIEMDPNYAPAYAGMSDTYIFLSDIYIPGKEAMPMARAAAQKAMELDETLAEAHEALAMVEASYDWKWTEADSAFKRALEINPSYAWVHNQYGIFLVAMGRFAEAKIEMDRARELDPLSPFIHVGTVWPVYFARQYDQAIEQLRRIIDLNPEFPNAYLNLGWAYTQKGMYQDAIAALRTARSLDATSYAIAALGYAYAKAGKLEEARKALSELQGKANHGQGMEYPLAIIYAGLGEKGQAMDALERAYHVRHSFLPTMKVDPFFDGLRSDPRFTDLLRRMNLVP